MVARAKPMPDDVQTLQALLAAREAELAKAHSAVAAAQQTIGEQSGQLVRRDAHISVLEQKLRALVTRQFGKRSEKHPDQFDFFNEAELFAGESDDDDALDDTGTQDDDGRDAARPRRKRRTRKLPDHLPRVEVVHDLDEADRRCECGNEMHRIGEETHEQLGVIPQQHFVIVHRRLKYGCSCRSCVRRAEGPAQLLPATAASAPLLAHSMVAKFHDGLPLYRQERIAAREGLPLSRAKLARWHIGAAEALQPVFNLLQDALWEYDIAASDATGIQVLKEPGRAPESPSYLWIRRGGPPGRPVVLVDYSPSHSGAVAHGLLVEFRGYLIVDAAPVFNEPARRNALVLVLCNDHCRRKFREALSDLGKTKAAKRSIAAEAIKRYRTLYRLEATLKGADPQHRHDERQRLAVVLWDDFIEWATRVQAEGVAHDPTRRALSYMLKHADGLRRYCEDPRLPMSNIATEHVAKTVSIARKNFLFADTQAGARSSARIYSVLETARACGHDAQRYMAVLLDALPLATTVESIEALLPWNLTGDEVHRRYAAFPTP